MTSITDIPYDDIKLFLINNKVRLSVNEKNNYNKAFEMIKHDKNYIYPDSIIDWIIAYNFDGDIPKYSKLEIDSLDDEELNNLAEELGIFESNNIKTSLLNVLKYLHKLVGIVNPDIDFYINNIYEELDKQKLLKGNYDEIIDTFKKNKNLRIFFYDNMIEIISNNLLDKNNFGLSCINLLYPAITKIMNFIVDLLKMNETVLVKEALKIINKLMKYEDDKSVFMYLIFNKILNSGDVLLIEYYLKLLPYTQEIYQYNAVDDLAILNEIYESLSKPYLVEKYLIPFLTAAINIGNIFYIKKLIDIWNKKGSLLVSNDQRIVEEVNMLIKKAEKLLLYIVQ